MTQTQLILLRSCSKDLQQAIGTGGPIVCGKYPTADITLSQPPKIQSETGRVPLSKESICLIERTLALSCTYDSDKVDAEGVRHQLQLVAIALQLVKPTFSFLQLWVQLDRNHTTEMVERSVSDLGLELGPEPYLQYQQHNCLTQSDLKRALAFLPKLTRALDTKHGSWNHPLLPIHRALILFCQGYSVTPPDPNQFLWAAGLDCLYASKLDRKKQGSVEIGRRMQQFLGAKLKLYEADTVSIPINQKTRRIHEEVENVTANIFKLRNAFAHGLPIPNINWLSDAGQPYESGYAYQLLEQTEIALRLTLLKVLENQLLFDTFSDPVRLEAYFNDWRSESLKQPPRSTQKV